MTRRDFLRASAAGMALATFAPHVAGAAADRKPLRVALIGSGWYGKVDLWHLMQVAPVEIVSMCDVDKKMLADAAEWAAARQPSKKTPRTYADYRELLKEKDVDAVLIDTPDHWHALPMIAACEAGADVYCQKPISVDVLEGEAMLAAARKHGRVVQVGTQRRSTPHLVEARDQIVRAGKLGKVGLVEICCYYPMRRNERVPGEQPPAHLDWEAYTGPAPMRPYNRIVHPRGWRQFMEYGNGIVGDMGVHFLDMTRWMLDLGWPKSVTSTGGTYVGKDATPTIPDTQNAVWDFGDVQVAWTHRTWGEAPDPAYAWGAVFYGDKGTLKCSVKSYDFIPTGGDKSGAVHRDCVMELDKFPADRDEKALELHVGPATRAHMKNFLDAIESRGKPVADIEQGHISTASCILANLSMKLGRTLRYDPARREVPGDAEATQALARPYRGPWQHPTVA